MAVGEVSVGLLSDVLTSEPSVKGLQTTVQTAVCCCWFSLWSHIKCEQLTEPGSAAAVLYSVCGERVAPCWTVPLLTADVSLFPPGGAGHGTVSLQEL